MKKEFLLVLSILLTLSCSLICSPLSAKLPNPFRGELVPEQVAAAIGTTTNVRLTLTTTVAFPAATIAIALPKGLELVDGPKVREVAPFKIGQKTTTIYSIRIKKPGEQRLTVTVKAKGTSAMLGYSQSFIATFNPPPPKETGVHAVDSDGTKVFIQQAPKRSK